MTRILPTFVTAVALALLSLSTHALELGDSPLALVGDGDLQAVVAPTADDSQALVRLSGVNHPIDGVVFLANIEKREDDSRAYRAEVDGKMRSLVVYAKSYWAPTDYTAYVPGQDEPYAVKVDEERSAQLKPNELMAQYEQQMGNGVQAELARFDRGKALQRQQSALQAMDESASKVCGTPITTHVNWEALTNDQLNKLNIVGYCGQVVAEIEHFCLRDDAFKERIKEISKVDCGFADSLNVGLDGQTLVFQTKEDAQNQRDAITGFLQTL